MVEYNSYSECTSEAVRVTVPEGKYRVVCRDGKIDLNNGLGLVSGGDISVAPRSALIMHQ